MADQVELADAAAGGRANAFQLLYQPLAALG
jgi:hypothetical protein